MMRYVWLATGGLGILVLALILIPIANGTVQPTLAFSKIITSYNMINAKKYNDVLYLNYPYAQISDLTTQNAGLTATNVTLSTNDNIYHITHSTTTKTNEIKIQDSGIYQIIAVPQVGEAGPGQASGTHDFWMMKNNLKVVNSNVKTTVMTQQATGQTMTATVNWVGYLKTNDIISFQHSSDDTDIGLIFTSAGTPPTTPSIIISIVKVS